MHLGHECDTGQMLAEAIMQILPDSPLFSRAYIQDCFFQVLSFGDVDTGGDDVMGAFSSSRKERARPGNQPLISTPRYPIGLIVLRKKIGTQHFKHGAEALCLLGNEKQVPDIFALNFLHRISSGQFTSGVEAQDTSFAVEDDNQGSDRVEDGGDKVTLLLQFFFDAFDI